MADNAISTPKTKFFTKDLVKCIVVLAALALVAGLLLGLFNWLTYVDPDETIKSKVATYYAVESANVVKNDDRAQFDGINSCFVANGEDGNAKGYCYYAVGGGAKDGTIELLVYIDDNGVITEITVYAQGETAGYFNRVEEANKNKYVGLDLDEIDGIKLVSAKSSSTENDGVVAAVSGATYTSTGYHNAIASAVNAYKNYNGGDEV